MHTSLQEHCYQWNAKPSNECKHFYENVNVKFDVETQRIRKACCKKKKKKQQPKNLLEENLMAHLNQKKKKKKNQQRERGLQF